MRHLSCLIEGLINETSCRPFNGDEFPWHRSEAAVFSFWNYNETQMIFFFEWRRRAVNSLTQSCRLLDFRRPSVNKETGWRRTWRCYKSGGSCVPRRGFHTCLTGRRKIPPQISPVGNPAVEKQTQRRFLDCKAEVLSLSFWEAQSMLNFPQRRDFVWMFYFIDHTLYQLWWVWLNQLPISPNKDKTNDAFKPSPVSQTFPGICPPAA